MLHCFAPLVEKDRKEEVQRRIDEALLMLSSKSSIEEQMPLTPVSKPRPQVIKAPRLTHSHSHGKLHSASDTSSRIKAPSRVDSSLLTPPPTEKQQRYGRKARATEENAK